MFVGGNLIVQGNVYELSTEIITGSEVVAGTLVANSGTASTSTTTGALLVNGGAGVTGAIYAGSIQATPIGSASASTGAFTTLSASGTSNLNTITGASYQGIIGNITPSAGTFTDVTVNNTLTAQTINAATIGNSGAVLTGTLSTTSQPNVTSLGTLTGLTVSGIESITNTTNNNGTTYSSGALQVAGGAGIAGNLYVGGDVAVVGNINLSGNVNTILITGNSGQFFGNAAGFGALYTGIASGYVFQPQTVLQNSTNFNSWAQINHQNINPGNQATTDFVATADTGTATTNYINFGISSSGYVNTIPNNSLGTSLYPLDGYLYVQSNIAGSAGGNLVLGTSVNGTVVKMLVGGINNNSVVSTFTTAGLTVNVATVSTSISTGALVVAGGAGIAGSVYAGSIQATPIGSTTASTGAFTTLNANLTFIANGAVTHNSTTDLIGATAFTTATGGGLQVLAIGNVTPGTGVFTTLNTTSTMSVGNILTVTDITESINYTNGALVVAGGTGIGANLHVHGNASIEKNLTVTSGNLRVNNTSYLVGNSQTGVNSVYAGILSGYQHVPNDIAQFSANVNSYAQINFQNINHGSASTADIIVTSDIGTDTIYYVDIGIAGSNYSNASPVNSLGNVLWANDAYLYAQGSTGDPGGNLVVGTTTENTKVKIIAGGPTSNNVSAIFGSPGKEVLNWDDENTWGTFHVDGGISGTASLIVAGNVTGINGVTTYGDVQAAGRGRFISGITTDGRLVVNNTDDASSTASGAIQTLGGAGIQGNAFIGGNLYVGTNAYSTDLTNPVIVAVNNGTQYAQIAIQNISDYGSSDFIAYGSTYPGASNDHGWVDVGYTGPSFNDPLYTITKPNDGYLFASANASGTVGGNLVLSTDYTGTHNDIVIGVGSFYANAEVARFHGNTSNNGYLTLDYTTNSSPANSTGALRVAGGASFSSNVYVGGAVTINGSRTATNDVIVKGSTDDALIWARPGTVYDQVVIGGDVDPTALVRGAKLHVNSSDSIIIPVGTNADRPSAIGGTDTVGMMRFNTTSGKLEIYDGTQWSSFTATTTVITDEQFSGNGTDYQFTLGEDTTTAAVIVNINGVVQIPTLAYTIVDGNVLTFTEPPANGDVIDVRNIVSTTSVAGISSINGYMQIVTDNDGVKVYTGTSSASVTTSWEPTGAEVSSIGNVSVSSANTPTTIDTLDTTKYRSAKYIVQVTNGDKYQVQEVLVISNGTTATAVPYGTVQTNGNLGVVAVTQSGTNALVQFIAANATNSVRIKKDYLLI